MRRHPVTLLLLLLASAAAGAEGQGSAPLETSRQALKTLQADQAAKDGAAAAGKLTDGLPRLETPMPGATLGPEYAPREDARQRDRKLQQERQQNWLLDGVDQLGRDNGNRKTSHAKGTDGLQEDEEPEQGQGRAKAGSMLQLYADQKKEAEEKSATRRAAGTRHDPIAPFLQGWLGNSPVRGKFFDEFVRNPSGDPVAAAGPEAAEFRPEPGTSSIVANNQSAPAEAPRTNPYLAAMESSAATGPGSARADVSMAASAATGGPVAAAAGPVIDPQPAAKPVAKKPPLPALSDNEKYFPQQKKF